MISIDVDDWRNVWPLYVILGIIGTHVILVLYALLVILIRKM